MKKIAIFFITVLTFFLIGCSGNNKTDIEENTPKEVIQKTDILTEKWEAPSNEIIKAEGWEIVSYKPGITSEEYTDGECFLKSLDAYEDKLYMLFCIDNFKLIDPDNIEEYHQQIKFKEFDTVTMESRIFNIDPELQDEVSVMPFSIDAASDHVNVFLKKYEDGQISGYSMLTFDLDGNLINTKEYSSVDAEAEKRGLCDISGAVIGCDGEIFLYDTVNGDIYVSGEDSDSYIKTEMPEGIKAASLDYAGKSIGGIPVFYAEINGGRKLLFTVSDGQPVKLYEGELESDKVKLDDYGNALILYGQRLGMWNTDNGKQEELYHFSGFSALDCREMMRNTEGDIIAVYHSGNNSYIYKLKDDPDFEITEIVLLSNMTDQYLSDCAAEYMRTHPGVKIELKDMEKRDGLEWNILAEDIKAGKGPDLIYLNRRQLTVLKEAQILEPLDTLISDDVKKNMFEGAYKFGEYGDEHYALPISASLSAYKVNSKFVDRHSMKLGDLLDSFERAQTGSSEIMRVESISYNADESQLLWDLCLGNIEDSEFVDIENGKCYFESEGFYRLLRFCREHAEVSYGKELSEDEMIEQVHDGEAFLMAVNGVGDIAAYSRISSKLGEDYTYVMPSESGKEARIQVYWGLALNKESKNKEIATDFINALLSERYQLNYGSCYVRRDVILNNFYEKYGLFEKPGILTEKGFILLDSKKDGSSYADEFITLMDNASPISPYIEIQDIVMEEAGGYFSGAKDEYTAAKVIQSRVQLYLDENR